MNEPTHAVPNIPDSPESSSARRRSRTTPNLPLSRSAFSPFTRSRLAAAASARRTTTTKTSSTSILQLNALEQRIASLEADAERNLNAWIEAEEGKELVEQSLRVAEAALESEKAVVSQLRAALDAKKTMGRDEHLMRHLADLVSDKLTPEGCLYLIQFLYGDRVVVLESAFKSARNARDFKRSETLLKLLGTFATEYHQALAAGKGDCEAAVCLGDAVAVTESHTTKTHPRAIKERTFEYNGQPVVMLSHLRIGRRDSVSETLRVHFDWRADEAKLVIGWCGEHRFLLG